ncbi:MAG: hypothetical protein ABL953_05940 [Ilumatobacteraceae bacterium]
MSFQPQAQPQAQSGGRGLTVAGVLIFILGLAAGAALFFLSSSTEEETVKKFARAPANCTTTLQFDRADTFEVYLETAGVLDNVSGDCAANGSGYNHADDDPPRVALSLADDAGTEVSMTPGTGSTYDVGGFRGQAVQQVAIPAAGTYHLTVTSDANDFVIAIGGESDTDAKKLQLAAIGSAIAGVVMGFVLLIAGHRAKRSTPAPAQGTWPPAAPGPGWGAPQP